MLTLLLYCLVYFFGILGQLFLHLEKKSRGKGSWYPDRRYLMLAGASFALAVVSAAAWIVSFIG
jgi:hypothetical protein